MTDRINLTPVAIREGQAVADTLFGQRPVSVDHDHVASAVFCTPEIGSVGLTEHQARERLAVVDIYRAAFRPLKATLSGRSEKMILKLVVDGITDRVVGVHILGHDAGEMIQMCAIAVHMGATKADFDATMAVHPTIAEEIVTMRSRTARHTRAVRRLTADPGERCADGPRSSGATSPGHDRGRPSDRSGSSSRSPNGAGDLRT